MPHFTTGTRQTNNTVMSQPRTKINPLTAIAGGSGILNFIGGIATNIMNRNFARNQANTAWQRELEQWHRANAYNAPKAQMERLKAAGLNPNMVYGTGTQATGQAASSAPNAQTAKFQAQYQQLDAAERIAKIKNIEADTMATITGEKYTGTKIEGQQYKNAVDAVKAQWAQDGQLRAELLAKLGLTNTAKDLNIARKKLIQAQETLTNNKANLMKSGLNNSDNVILRLIGTWGVKNPVEASQLLIWLGSLGNNL